MNKNLISFLLSLLIFSSCSSEEEEMINDVKPHAGIWSGTFDGDDEGTWTMDVSNTGDIKVQMISTFFEETYGGSGSVTADGVLEASVLVDRFRTNIKA